MTEQSDRMPGGAQRTQDESKTHDMPLMRSLHRATRYHDLSKSKEPLLTCHPRIHHTQLNQLILSRLPLCLPPHTQHPNLYATGLLQFAPIYVAFEAAWQLLSDYEPTSELGLETAVVLSSLIHLHIPTLQRTERLRQDLSLLLRQPLELIDVRLQHPDSRQAREFVRHIKAVACYKPHALIAYTWVMYMALFNGGRWIREQLSTARDLTWVLTQDSLEVAAAFAGDSTHSEAGLSFWHFEGAEDGDDIKTEFKARLVDVGAMLSPDHKADIVQEASEIFKRCVGLVEEIDSIVAPSMKPQRIDVRTIRMAEMQRIRRISIFGCLLEYILQIGFLQVFVAVFTSVLSAMKSFFEPIGLVIDSNSIMLDTETY
ncbi:MAG: hypothetical protein LQ340_006321 [Diploschistes diacapsis]|nr:MAG: hypothetical protein LQ340_006321 [Diploschistes diacapsis]